MIEQSFRIRPLQEANILLFLVEQPTSGIALAQACPSLNGLIQGQFLLSGGSRFRAFDLDNSGVFHVVVAEFGRSLLTYEFASAQRPHVSDCIYSSAENLASQHIPLHNDQSYTHNWAVKLWFRCVMLEMIGGEVPIADSGECRDVEFYCGSKGTVCKWKLDGKLRARHMSEAVERHPVTDEFVCLRRIGGHHLPASEKFLSL